METVNWAQWYMTVILALGRLRREDYPGLHSKTLSRGGEGKGEGEIEREKGLLKGHVL